LQGGLLPSWQTTVVVEFAGTTTVVLAGGGGLLLLMQPHNSPAAIISVVRVFTMSSGKWNLLGALSGGCRSSGRAGRRVAA
jgi:hypothetical protein